MEMADTGKQGINMLGRIPKHKVTEIISFKDKNAGQKIHS
jgi:hypothetical protein